MESEAEQILLLGSDGVRVKVTRSIATEASHVLRDLLDGKEACEECTIEGVSSSSCGDTEGTRKGSTASLIEVPIPGVTGETLKLVWEHMKYRFQTAVASDDEGRIGYNVYAIPIKPIPKPMTLPLVEYLDAKDRAFIVDWDEQRTIRMVKAATLLRYEELLQLASAKLATYLMEKSTESIRTMIGVECDFTADELAQLKREEQMEYSTVP